MARPFAFKLNKPAIEEPTINLTALIDVVFVILIMFILIAPLLELDRVELAEGPKEMHENNVSVQETSPISVHVQADNSIWLNKKPVSLKELATRLKKVKNQFPKSRPQLFHDRKAHFGTYQSVKNALEEAGFKEVDIVLKPA
jgi:biopolymer transport protein ExbD